MIRALVVLGLLGVGQAYINSQKHARRQKRAHAMDAKALDNWDDEGGAAVPGSVQPGLLSRNAAPGSLGNYPAAGQAG